MLGIFFISYFLNVSTVSLFYRLYQLAIEPTKYNLNILLITSLWSFFGTFKMFLVGLSIGWFYFNQNYGEIKSKFQQFYGLYQMCEDIISEIETSDHLIDENPNDIIQIKKIMKYLQYVESKVKLISIKISFLYSFAENLKINQLWICKLVISINNKIESTSIPIINYLLVKMIYPLINYIKSQKYINGPLAAYNMLTSEINNNIINPTEEIITVEQSNLSTSNNAEMIMLPIPISDNVEMQMLPENMDILNELNELNKLLDPTFLGIRTDSSDQLDVQEFTKSLEQLNTLMQNMQDMKSFNLTNKKHIKKYAPN